MGIGSWCYTRPTNKPLTFVKDFSYFDETANAVTTVTAFTTRLAVELVFVNLSSSTTISDVFGINSADIANVRAYVRLVYRFTKVGGR